MISPDNETNAAKRGFIEHARNKELALQLADRQEHVINRLLVFCEKQTDRFEDMGGFKDEDDLWFSVDEGAFQGIEHVGIGITCSFKGSDEFRSKVGVNTAIKLNLGLYTDRETWEAVRQLEAYDWEGTWGVTLDEVKERVGHIFTGEEIDDMTFPGAASSDNYGTYYFADKEGNFAKVINIPEELANGRSDLQIEGHHIGGTVSVQVPMLARDFVFYKVSLETLSNVLDRECTAPVAE